MKLTNFARTVCLLPIISMAGFFAPDAMAAEATLELTVDGISTLEGQIAIVVFADSEGYETSSNPIGRAMVEVYGNTITAHFDGLESGPCAIKLFHDVNNNGELDKNLIGMPTEPFGFSNGAVVRFGPPSFEASTFTLGEGDNRHQITLASMGG